MIKYTVERIVTRKELENIPEKRGRVFKIKYFDTVDHISTEKIFQYKHNLNNFLNNPRWSRIKYFVGEIRYE